MITAIDTAPVMDLRPPDVDSLVEELQAYHAIYSPLFQRREQRQWSAEYLRGLLLEIPRKSIEPMMLALQGADQNAIRAMQQFVGEGAWNDDAILKRHWREVDETLGDEDGVLTLDGSDFLKQGTESVGVKRQYCGEVDKRANCQAGVFLGYASSAGYTLLDGCDRAIPKFLTGRESNILPYKSNLYKLSGKDVNVAGLAILSSSTC